MKKAGIIAIFVFMFFLIGCSLAESELNVQTKKEVEQKLDLDAFDGYPYANSSHIYTIDNQYSLDGSGETALDLYDDNSLYDLELLCVNDMWYYCYEYQDEDLGKLWRIPLQNGQLEKENKTKVVDLADKGGFTIVGDYFVGISRSNICEVYDMNREKRIEYKLPEEVAYTKKTEWVDRTWGVMAQGEDWVLWMGDNGGVLQSVPTGEMTMIGKGEFDLGNVLAAIPSKSGFFFVAEKTAEKDIFCYYYDLHKNRKQKIKKTLIANIISKYCNVGQDEIHNISLDEFYRNGDDIFVQVNFDIVNEKSRLMLKQENVTENPFVVDTGLSDILQKNPDMDVVDCFMSKWFFIGDHLYCYDMKSQKFDEVSEDSPMRNIYYVLEK